MKKKPGPQEDMKFEEISREDHGRPPGETSNHVAVEADDTSGSRLLITLLLNFIIPVVQIIGGVVANSMALISDAAHNFSDFVAILIAYFAHLIGKKGASPRNTFGYKRAEVLAALINVAILLGASAFIVYGAVERFYRPQPVLGNVVILLAGVGIAGNGLSAWLLHRDSKHSLNVRGAFLHMMGDLLTSVMVLISGAIFLVRPWYWLDPLLSIFIVLFILKNCWSIVKGASNILMNATPEDLHLSEVKARLEKIPGVLGVHYLHAWRISSNSTAFSCHVLVSDQPVSETRGLFEAIRHELSHEFGIDHPVLQFETTECGNGGILCENSCGVAGNG
ncbi:MAG: cation diffusion facilitator family transporter [Deltaproteobacteria bacterium]|nr:cation diffusion facilitator family transporter [Deltaproteobacteria bacterium]